jgi:very-short-patch-repair endonuclease
MRLSAIRFIKEQNGGCVPRYNPIACQQIDKYSKQHGFNFQHALNGGEFHIKELGYFVDGYDEDKNVVIEYYEKKHRNKIERDEKRKQEIIDHLGCVFIELKEWKE